MDDVSRIYILVKYLVEWQRETGQSLEELLVYMEEHYEKRK